jgi:hypothetical protein
MGWEEREKKKKKKKTQQRNIDPSSPPFAAAGPSNSVPGITSNDNSELSRSSSPRYKDLN